MPPTPIIMKLVRFTKEGDIISSYVPFYDKGQCTAERIIWMFSILLLMTRRAFSL